jgi:hypothetical protein
MKRVLLFGCFVVFVVGLLVPEAQAAPKTSAAVAYITDFGAGSNDICGPSCGSSIFVNALTGAPAGGTYTTADLSKTVAVTDVPVATIDLGGAAVLAPYDTAIVYQVCDISSHPATMSALNTFLTNGGKLLLYDADRCAPGEGGLANYSSFLFPFSTSSPGPRGASGSYTAVVASTLTAGLAVGPQPGDSVGDANIFTSFSGDWCASITATNTLGANGFVEATARTPSGGLVVYEGEDFWFTFGPTSHLRLVFDDMLKQDWAPDGLPCTIPASGISLAPASQTQNTGSPATVTATVVDINGNPVSGQAVSFTVTSGPNAGVTGGATTDGAGHASFTYTSATTGTDTLIAQFKDTLGNTHTSNSVTVTWADPSISATGGFAFKGTEPASVGGTVATFTDPDTSATAGEYSATVDWGDGSSSAGTISGGSGSFTVTGSHTYADEGSYTISVTITDVDNASNTATVTDSASIADAALSASGLSLVSPPTYTGPVATFTDANNTSTTADFTATIDWGDGSNSIGTVVGGAGSFTVDGSHTYGSLGPFTIKVHIVDDGGSTADATSTIVIFGVSAGGTFVIGDGNAAIGTSVTFWGAQWWKLNTLSGGAGPAAFKGFEDSPATAQCKVSWTTDPGNSTPPPAGPLPAYMAVIVSSKVTQSGSTISGDTPHIVIVKTNPGYAPDPGHAGTGTVVATVC